MTVNPDEILVVVDENNNVTGQEPRKLVHEKGLWHRTSDAWIVNKRGMLLCSQRSFAKDSDPGMWDSRFGGHVLASDDYLSSLIKELKEEIGLDIKEGELIEIGLFKSYRKKDFPKQYLLRRDLDATALEFEKDEIERVEWFDFKDVWNNLVVKPNRNWVQEPFFKDILQFIEDA